MSRSQPLPNRKEKRGQKRRSQSWHRKIKRRKLNHNLYYDDNNDFDEHKNDIITTNTNHSITNNDKDNDTENIYKNKENQNKLNIDDDDDDDDDDIDVSQYNVYHNKTNKNNSNIDNEKASILAFVLDDDEDEDDDDDEEEEDITTIQPKEPKSVTQRIDDALGQYYKNMGRSDYYDDGDEDEGGLFLKWCEENGYDDDDLIEDELGNTAEYTDCSFTDFTDDFPFNLENVELNDDQKDLEMFKVLQHCYKYGFDVRIKYGFDPLSDLTPTQIFMTKYLDGDREKDIDFDLSAMEKEQTALIYQAQCDNVFGKKIITDDGFEYGLAVGIKNNYFPFMQYLVDIYMRFCLQYALKDINHRTLNDIKFKDWLRKEGNKLFNHLDKHKISDIIGAVDIYLRLCPSMHVTKPLTTINDDLSQIIQYLVIANNIIINKILKIRHDDNGEKEKEKENKENTPFQFDLIIACNSVKCTQTICKPPFNSSSDDDNNDDDDDDDDESNYKDTAFEHLNEDVLGDVHRKLNENKLKNINVTLSAIRKPDCMDKFENIDEFQKKRLLDLCAQEFNVNIDDINKSWTYNQRFAFLYQQKNDDKTKKVFDNDDYKELCNMFSKLRLLSLKKILNEVYKDFNISNIILFDIIDHELECDDINQSLCNFLDINRNRNHFESNKKSIINAYEQFAELHGDDRKQISYPYKQRICMFVDRRSFTHCNRDLHKYCDDILFYSPPEGSDILPMHKQIVSESFFNLSQKCLIPKIGYKDGVNEAMYTMNMMPKERMRNSTITVRTAPGGNVLIFSFHILAKDIIKCYLFRDSQFNRFLPQDIKHILPRIFNLKYNENQQFVDNDNKIYEMISKLTYSDKLFNSWYNNRAKGSV